MDAQYEFATSFNLNPLISNEKAYIIDKDYDLEGQYNISTGIFESLDGNYYFYRQLILYMKVEVADLRKEIELIKT